MDKDLIANWRAPPAWTRRWRNSPTMSPIAAGQAIGNAGGIAYPTDPAAEPWPPMRAGNRTMNAADRLHWLTAAEATRAFAAAQALPGRAAARRCWRASIGSTRSCIAFIRLDADAAMDAARAAEARDRRRPRPRAAARRAGRHQGHHRRRRPADHLPFEDPARQRARPRTRWWSPSCGRPARSSWASCPRTNSPSAAPASTCRSRRRATRGTRSIIPAAHRPAPAPASAPGCSRWRSAPTPADRCAIRPAPAASSD